MSFDNISSAAGNTFNSISSGSGSISSVSATTNANNTTGVGNSNSIPRKNRILSKRQTVLDILQQKSDSNSNLNSDVNRFSTNTNTNNTNTIANTNSSNNSVAADTSGIHQILSSVDDHQTSAIIGLTNRFQKSGKDKLILVAGGESSLSGMFNEESLNSSNSDDSKISPETIEASMKLKEQFDFKYNSLNSALGDGKQYNPLRYLRQKQKEERRLKNSFGSASSGTAGAFNNTSGAITSTNSSISSSLMNNSNNSSSRKSFPWHLDPDVVPVVIAPIESNDSLSDKKKKWSFFSISRKKKSESSNSVATSSNSIDNLNTVDSSAGDHFNDPILLSSPSSNESSKMKSEPSSVSSSPTRISFNTGSRSNTASVGDNNNESQQQQQQQESEDINEDKSKKKMRLNLMKFRDKFKLKRTESIESVEEPVESKGISEDSQKSTNGTSTVQPNNLLGSSIINNLGVAASVNSSLSGAADPGKVLQVQQQQLQVTQHQKKSKTSNSASVMDKQARNVQMFNELCNSRTLIYTNTISDGAQSTINPNEQEYKNAIILSSYRKPYSCNLTADKCDSFIYRGISELIESKLETISQLNNETKPKANLKFLEIQEQFSNHQSEFSQKKENYYTQLTELSNHLSLLLNEDIHEVEQIQEEMSDIVSKCIRHLAYLSEEVNVSLVPALNSLKVTEGDLSHENTNSLYNSMSEAGYTTLAWILNLIGIIVWSISVIYRIGRRVLHLGLGGVGNTSKLPTIEITSIDDFNDGGVSGNGTVEDDNGALYKSNDVRRRSSNKTWN